MQPDQEERVSERFTEEQEALGASVRNIRWWRDELGGTQRAAFDRDVRLLEQRVAAALTALQQQREALERADDLAVAVDCGIDLTDQFVLKGDDPD